MTFCFSKSWFTVNCYLIKPTPYLLNSNYSMHTMPHFIQWILEASECHRLLFFCDTCYFFFNCGKIYITWASLVAQRLKHLPAMQRPGLNPWVGKIPWRRKWQPIQYSCLKNRMDRVDCRAIVQRVTDIGHISATKHVPPGSSLSSIALK